MEIPFERLSPDALNNLIEEFVSREGTDYGQREYSLADKVAHVRRQLETGRAVIVYDAEAQNSSIVVREA